MTTIAWKDGILAVDRQVTKSDFDQAVDYKLALTPDKKTAIAICGYMSLGLSFIDWYSKGRKEKFSIDASTSDPCLIASVVTVIAESPSSFEIEYWGNGLFPVPHDPNEYFAEGRGSEAALGAMYCGANAVEAVRAASHHCVHSGHGILFVDMNKAVRKIQRHR